MKKIGVWLTALLLAAAMAFPAQAKTFTGSDWTVTFTSENKLESNFKTSDIDDLILGMQPGDQAVVTLTLRNTNGAAVNWYMSNEVLSSLEDSRDTASGGAYTYRLIYTDPDGAENTLFDSDTVGGEDVGAAGEGLNEATDSLKNYFYLDTMVNGQSGSVTLTVALDGETQGNGYQDTLANLQMQFAAELQPSGVPDDPGSPAAPAAPGPIRLPGSPTTIARTGDLNMLPYIVAAAISGLLLLAYAVYSMLRQKRKGR